MRYHVPQMIHLKRCTRNKRYVKVEYLGLTKYGIIKSQKLNHCSVAPFWGAWWLIGRFDTFHLKVHGFESCPSRHVGTLGKSFTCCCLRCLDGKLQHSIHAESAEPLSSSGFEEAL